MNEAASQVSNPSITLTDNAALKISQLIGEENNSSLNLRVFITGGGCSGFQYGFVFDENIDNDDICVEKKVKKDEEEETDTDSTSVNLIIDPMSFQYLIGAEIDYKADIKGEQFIIRNPMAKTTCGCGASFSA